MFEVLAWFEMYVTLHSFDLLKKKKKDCVCHFNSCQGRLI